MTTCRCPICGKNNGSRKNNSRGLYIRHGIGRDEHDHNWDGLTKKEESRLLRTRLKREIRKILGEHE